jgi:vacuolar iron transporter family protein
MDANHLHTGGPQLLASPLVLARPRPAGLAELARHYLRDLIYGANDGIVTTFAVVTGVTGAALGRRTILILGIANLLADGFSMGASNYLSIRSDEAVREVRGEPVLEAFPQWHALATLVAFIAAGAVPLIPYLVAPPAARFPAAVAGTLATLFAVGALRSTITRLSWWKAGLEMLLIGTMAAGLAYGTGRFLARLT